jgi:excisionase family DNA binding protein
MAGVREKLLTASDLATLCEVDLKTIHNWVDRGRIAHFRTPGRHLRFRAADVAEFLRAWGYSVPRELARASSRTVMVIGTKDTVAQVQRALGEGGAAAPAPPGQPAPGKPGAPSGEPSAAKAPLRLAPHPYDALVYAGADPADIYVVDVRVVAQDIDVSSLLEALHRACPQGTFVALSDEPVSLPAFTTRVARGDASALRTVLLAEAPGAPAGMSATPAKPPPSSGASSLGKPTPTPTSIAPAPAASHGDDTEEVDEEPPRGMAVGGSSR